MIIRSSAVSFPYKVSRTIAAKLYFLRRDLEIDEEFKRDYKKIEDKKRVDDEVFRQHKKMWFPWSESVVFPRTEMDLYYSLSGVQSPEFVPIGIYFNTINATINNRLLAWGYAQKGNYAHMYDIDNEPLSFLRNLNGLFFDFKGNRIKEPEVFFETKLKDQNKVIVKPVIDSRGGQKILVFGRGSDGLWKCLNGEFPLDLNVLHKYYGKNYVVQEYVKQHPFYKRFNASSFNTFRIYVYRSPGDEIPRVLHSMLRIGGVGSVIDNIKAGGMPVYVDNDGIVQYGIDSNMRRVDRLTDEPSVKFKDLGKAPGLGDMQALALKVAAKVPYNRLIAFDINLDEDNKPRLIELNNFDAGIVIQIFGVPFFGEFTYEVIDYCKTNKKEDILRI